MHGKLSALGHSGSPRINTKLAEVAQSSLQCQSYLFCTIPTTCWSVHRNCVPTHPGSALLLVGPLQSPGDEVSEALAPCVLVYVGEEVQLETLHYPFVLGSNSVFSMVENSKLFCINSVLSVSVSNYSFSIHYNESLEEIC